MVLWHDVAREVTCEGRSVPFTHGSADMQECFEGSLEQWTSLHQLVCVDDREHIGQQLEFIHLTKYRINLTSSNMAVRTHGANDEKSYGAICCRLPNARHSAL